MPAVAMASKPPSAGRTATSLRWFSAAPTTSSLVRKATSAPVYRPKTLLSPTLKRVRHLLQELQKVRLLILVHLDGNVIVKCVSTGGGFDLTHYMVFQDKSDKIYMATNTKKQPDVGETRFIFRLKGLPDAVPFGDASKSAGSTSTIEGSDVFVVNGETRSKVRFLSPLDALRIDHLLTFTRSSTPRNASSTTGRTAPRTPPDRSTRAGCGRTTRRRRRARAGRSSGTST